MGSYDDFAKSVSGYGLGGDRFSQDALRPQPPIDWNRYTQRDPATAISQAVSGFGPDIAGNRAASAAGTAELQSLYPKGTYGGVTPKSVRDMPKQLAAESQQRFYGPTASRSGDANPNSVYGQGSVRTPNGFGSFAENGQTYSVGATSEDNIRRVTGGRLNSPLYTNIDPSQAIAGLNKQSIGQPAAEEALGLQRMQNANDIRGQMIANRDKDIPAGGYGPGILGNPNDPNPLDAMMEKLNAMPNKSRQDGRARADAAGLIRQHMLGENANALEGVRQQGAFGIEGMRGRNQLAAEGMRQQGALGIEGVRHAGRMDEIGAQGANQLAYGQQSLDAGAGLRSAQTEQAKSATALNQHTIDVAKGWPAHRAAAIKGWAEGFDRGAFPKDYTFEQYMADAKAAYDQSDLAAERALFAKEKKPNGGVVGYAGGGTVGPDGLTDAQRNKKNAALGNLGMSTAPAAAQPQGLPVPPRQQAPQAAPAGYLENIATGGLQRRMREAGVDGYAFGGAVSPQDIPGGRAVAQAVAGRQVFGQSDGSGEDDALPAVIDGERPAALTSGEFVWPVKAVQFYGLDKLNKMLAAAEKGMAAQGDTE